MTKSLPILGLLLAGCRSAPGVDQIVVGKVWTGDSANPSAEAVAIAGDTIVAVGDSTMILTLAGANTQRIDAGPGLAMPGFIDDHVHLFAGGFQLASVDLRDDLVVVDRDLLTMPPADIGRPKIRVTMVGGKIVYRAP